ncbi:MAG: cytidine deaminase [Ruminococcaceae bacterium]|nr:cytidine deaminase [Oscillospiraceae bacterium]
MTPENINKLILEAKEARKASYCPYSGFAVGAALLTADGRVYRGANIENASYTPTVCAERVAFFKAVSAGERKFKAIAIVGGNADMPISDFTPPCGVCRQVMSEFCGGDFKVILSDGNTSKLFTLAELFPEVFTLN